MSIYDRAMAQLSTLEPVFGFNPTQVEQGSLEWKIMRLGCLTASKADKIVAGKETEGRATYIAEIIGSIINCSADEESSFKQTEWGKNYEAPARDSLSAALGFVDIKEIPLIYMNNDLRVAVSPDGVFDETIVELKSPYDPTFHVAHMAFGNVKKAWKWQCQMQLIGSGADRHIFATYDPRAILANNLHYSETLPDESMQSTLRDAIPTFIADVDKALKKLGVEHSQHWNYLKQQRGNN
jgi:hypothetical protein